MKKIKKIASFLLAIVMVFTMATSAYAATTKITIEGTGTEYKAWRILNATDGESGKFAYTLNPKYTDILKDIIIEETEADITEADITEADIIAYINALKYPDRNTDDVIIKESSEKIREFADAVYRAIISKNITNDASAVNKVFSILPHVRYPWDSLR